MHTKKEKLGEILAFYNVLNIRKNDIKKGQNKMQISLKNKVKYVKIFSGK